MKIAVCFPDSEQWRSDARLGLFRRVLEGAGHKLTLHPLGGNKRTAVHCPTSLEPDTAVLLNHGLQADPFKLSLLAKRHPKTQFVSMCQSSLAHCEFLRWRYLRLQESILFARQAGNMWMAFQCPEAAKAMQSIYLPIPRAVHLPWPTNSVERSYRRPADPPKIVLAGRDDPVKNYFNQIMAVGLLERAELHLFTAGTTAAQFATAVGVKHERHGMMPHADWIAWLAENADVALQCSFSESYNAVACETMQLGIPTVTGGAIRFADVALIRDPNSPDAIATGIEQALNFHAHRSAVAKTLANESAQHAEKLYLETIEQIGGKRD